MYVHNSEEVNLQNHNSSGRVKFIAAVTVPLI